MKTFYRPVLKLKTSIEWTAEGGTSIEVFNLSLWATKQGA